MCHTSEVGITIYDVLTLGGAQQVGRPSQKGEIKVLCPRGVKTSRGKTATFDVNLAKGNFKCYRECSDCTGHGGMLDLYNLLCGSGADRKTAYAEIVNKLKHGDLPKIKRPAEPAFVPQKMQGNTADASVLDKAYRAFLATLTLGEKHRANLLSRGLTERAIQQGLYKSVPQGQAAWGKSLRALETQGIVLQGVPGFYRKNGRYCAATFRSGFFIPYFDEKGRICGMQIRFDVAKESGKRYLWFSSAGYEDGCSARNITSYGAPGLMPAVGSGRLVFVTEGALKAAAANVLDAKHHPIIAIGGVSCYGQWEETCRYLQSKNIHFVADAFDSDRETNASVQKSLEKLYSIAAQYGIRMQRCDWGTAQKGVDDFLLGAAVQTDDGVILSSLWDPRNFVPPVRYIKKNIPAMFKPPVYKPKHTA